MLVAKATPSEFDFPLRFYSCAGALHVFEKGVYKAGVGSYTSGHVLRIKRVGADILYKVNGTAVFTNAGISNDYFRAESEICHPNTYGVYSAYSFNSVIGFLYRLCRRGIFYPVIDHINNTVQGKRP